MLSRYGIFCGVIEHKSFTRTAEKLGYSQSAVSQAVRALELETETVLIDRRKDGIALTPDGEQYLPYFQQIHQAEQNLERKEQEMKGLKTVCCADWYVHQREPYLFAGTYDGI